MNTAQTRMLLETIRLYNKNLNDPKLLDERLLEMIESLDRPPNTKKDATQTSIKR